MITFGTISIYVFRKYEGWWGGGKKGKIRRDVTQRGHIRIENSIYFTCRTRYSIQRLTKIYLKIKMFAYKCKNIIDYI